MKNVSIFKPSKTTMQSGRGLLESCVLEYEPGMRAPEPLMGWTSSEDTLNQVQLKFSTQKEAIAFAKKKGWSYTITPPRERKVKARNHAYNFVYREPDLPAKKLK